MPQVLISHQSLLNWPWTGCLLIGYCCLVYYWHDTMEMMAIEESVLHARLILWVAHYWNSSSSWNVYLCLDFLFDFFLYMFWNPNSHVNIVWNTELSWCSYCLMQETVSIQQSSVLVYLSSHLILLVMQCIYGLGIIGTVVLLLNKYFFLYVGNKYVCFMA